MIRLGRLGARLASAWQVWLPAFFIAAFVSPLWATLGKWGGTFDWGYFFFLAEVDRTSVLTYGQFPLWNPFYCGGAVHLANPQTYFLSPTFLLILAFGTPIGIRLTLTVGIVLAYDGARRLCRALGISQVGALVGGLGYAMCGTLAQHLGGGHVGWLGFCLFPHVLYSFHRALDGSRRHAIYGALWLAWIFGHFGGYTFPYSCLALAIYGLLTGLAAGRGRMAVLIVAAMGAGALALSAVRLLPILDFVRGHPRFRPDRDFLRVGELFEIYGVRHRTRFVPGHDYVWPEYGNYLGVTGLALAAIGVWVLIRERRRLWPVAVTAWIFLLYQLGNVAGLPWSLTKRLPIFRYMRVPSRFTILVGLMACILSGLAVARFVDPILSNWRLAGGRARFLAVAGALLAVVFLVDIDAFNREQWFPTMTGAAPTDAVSPQFKQMPGEKGRMYAYPRANLGSLACFEESPLDISPSLRANLPADEYAADATSGTVNRISWSPNRIVVETNFNKPGRVVVNQNWNPHWHVDGGRANNDRGLLAATVDGGRRRVTFRYLPRPFLAGLAITMAALGMAILLWWRWRPISGSRWETPPWGSARRDVPSRRP